MMRKILFVGAFLFLCSHSYSQKHQISAGMGIGSSNQILDVMESAFSPIFFSSSTLNQTSEIGEFRLSYAYTPLERWHYGATVSYSSTNFDVNFDQEKIGEQVNTYYTLAAETSYSYLKKEKVNMYALVGAGATFGTSKKQIQHSDYDVDGDYHDTFFNFQVTPIGVSYGKQWGGFAELGFGYRGIFSFGVFYNFD
ncbi:hypothetical protein EI546_01795 [Aequorivita sp. H23M31]|uniref:Outer membrane protein beta-barrel domain-containing protein n=1 Tax=Aequorivita ciconiae TaxID=2494375 RepID=A0A410FZU1_9FLAO|nr:hypothetical protein [Aequorivita sp. H23M31]QAA80537.1 hypothetical protein EI546_01795 [Aequorivita sp. H23M31]